MVAVPWAGDARMHQLLSDHAAFLAALAFRAEDPGSDSSRAADPLEPDERVAVRVDELRGNLQHTEPTGRRIPDGGPLRLGGLAGLHPAHGRRAIDRLGAAPAVVGWRVERSEGDLGRRSPRRLQRRGRG